MGRAGAMEVTWLMETTTGGQYEQEQQQQQPYYELYTTAQFVTGLILYPIICLFGLTGNALIIVVLVHKVALSSTDVLIAALAISDAVKLINDLLYSATCATMQVNPSAGQSMYAYLYPYAHFVVNAALCVSAWLVVALAVERYLLVCWPTRTRNLTSAARSRAVAAAVIVVMTSIAVPSALRYRTVRVDDGNASWHMDVELTQLWRVDAFVVSYNWTQSLLRSIIPLVILVFTGIAIVAALRRRPSLRVDDRKVAVRRRNRKSAVRRRIAVMLVIVVLAFVVCVIPDAVMSALYLGYTESDSYLVKAIRDGYSDARTWSVCLGLLGLLGRVCV